MIEKFNKENIGNLRIEISEALKPIEEKNGIKMNLGSIRFTPEALKGPLEVVIRDPKSPGKSLSDIVYEKNLKNLGESYGISDEVGTRVIDKGRIFTLAGINTKGKRYPIILNATDGKQGIKCDSNHYNGLKKVK